jgi:hypothetical protein
MYNSHGSMSIVYLAVFCVVVFLVVSLRFYEFILIPELVMAELAPRAHFRVCMKMFFLVRWGRA